MIRHSLFGTGLAIGLAAASADAITITMVCELRGGQEVPAVASDGFGCGRFTIDTTANTLEYYIAFGGLTSAENNAHIHGPADPGVGGAGIIHPLPLGNPKVGVWNYPEAMEPDILAGRTYVNIHTVNNGAGELRGQINHFTASLDGAQEAVVGPAASKGWATFNIDTCANELDYHIVAETLGSVEVAAHIHGFAVPGVNAGVLHPLPPGPVKTGTWNYPESAEEAILNGMTYVNIHTANFGDGEIRGQIVNTIVPHDGAQETNPPGPPLGFGNGYIAFDQPNNTLGYYIKYGGLSSAENNAHIHGFAPPGMGAGVLHQLPATNPKKGQWAYGAANAANVLAGLTYINIHTVNFSNGEIRGQIIAPAPKCAADTDCTGVVDVDDLVAVILAWGDCPADPKPCPSDIDYSGATDVDDLVGVILGWGDCP
jgi:hypothetical protein